MNMITIWVRLPLLHRNYNFYTVINNILPGWIQLLFLHQSWIAQWLDNRLKKGHVWKNSLMILLAFKSNIYLFTKIIIFILWLLNYIFKGIQIDRYIKRISPAEYTLF